MVTLVPEISALSSIFDVRGGGGKDRRDPTSQGRKGSAEFRHAVRWERNCEYLARRRSGAGGRSSARGPEASLPTARSSQRCAEWRRAPGTLSWGSPWTGR